MEKPEPGQIVFGCKHIFEFSGGWHFFSLEGYKPVMVEGELVTPEWVALCENCFMLPGTATEHVGAWFEWQESMQDGIKQGRVM